MLAKIKELLFGKPSEPEAPYKVEATAPKVVEPIPAGTEASIVAAPVVEKPAEPKPTAEKKPVAKPVVTKAPAKPKATPKPKAPRKPAAK